MIICPANAKFNEDKINCILESSKNKTPKEMTEDELLVFRNKSRDKYDCEMRYRHYSYYRGKKEADKEFFGYIEER